MIGWPSNKSAAAALVAAAVAVPSVTGCGGDGGGDEEDAGESPRATPAVQIKEFEFVPTDIEVESGTTVRWTNEDNASHTASADKGGSFDTGTIKTGQTKTATLEQPGTFATSATSIPS